MDRLSLRIRIPGWEDNATPTAKICERCVALQRQIRDLEIEVHEATARRHAAQVKPNEAHRAAQDVERKLTMLNETKLIYGLHKQRAHK